MPSPSPQLGKRHGFLLQCQTCGARNKAGGYEDAKQFAKLVRETHKQHRGHSYDLKQSFHAAELQHLYVEKNDTEQTIASTTYSDFTSNSIAAASFTAGKKYLLSVTAHMRSSVATTACRAQVVHGTTVFPESVGAFVPQTTTSREVYAWFTVFTQPVGGAEIIKCQISNSTAANTTGIDQFSIVAIKLDDDLIEDTDWFFNETSTSTNLALNTDTSTNNATETVTPATANQKWLVMARSRMIPNAATRSYGTRIVRSGEASSTGPFLQREGGSATLESLVYVLPRVFQLGAASNTFTEKSFNTQSAGGTRSHSGIFVLNLSKLRNEADSYDDSSVQDITGTAYASPTNIRSISITPDVAGDVWCYTFLTSDQNAQGSVWRARMRVGGTDQPPTQTTDNYSQCTTRDSTDEMPFNLQTIENLSAAATTIDLDAVVNSVVSGKGARAKSAFAVTMELPATGAALTKLVPETEAISENVVVWMKHVDVKNETEAIQENIGIRMAHTEVKAETEAVTENVVVRVKMAPRFANETENITENVLFTIGRRTVINETASIGENVVVKVNRVNPPINETVAIPEQVIVKVTMAPRIVNETEAVTENVVYRMNMARVINETESVLENVIAQVKLPAKVINEVEAITENVVVKLGLSRAISETVAVPENVVVLVKRVNQPINETADIGENIVVKVNRIEPPINETVSIPEQVIVRVQNIRPPVNETVGVTENVIARLGIIRPPIDETVGILENVVASLGITRPPVNETVSIPENVVVKLQLAPQQVNETVAISEATVLRMDRVEPPINEIINLPEDVVVRMDRVELVGEQLSISENIIVKLTTPLAEEINEVVSISENVTVKVTEVEVFPAPTPGGRGPKTFWSTGKKIKAPKIRQKRRIWPQMSLKTYDPVKRVRQDTRYDPPTLQQQLSRPRTKVRRAFTGQYDILPLSPSQRRTLDQAQQLDLLTESLNQVQDTVKDPNLRLELVQFPQPSLQQTKPSRVAKSFVGKYDILSKINKPFTGKYDKYTKVSKTFIGNYDIKVFDWAKLQKLQLARTMLVAMAAMEELESVDSLDEQ